MTLEKEQEAAKNNFERLNANIPKHLSNKEDHFSDKIQKAKTNPAKKLSSLYDFMNDLYKYVSTYTPCKKGCNNCCHYSVTISEIEIKYIERHTKNKRNKPYHHQKSFHGTPCPFLIDKSCSIYHARPFVCRRHVTLTNTNTWCDPKISNNEKFPLLQFSSIDEAYKHILIKSESFDLFDIRQVFGKGSYQ